jgi:dUTP pyrophosphatase
VDNIILQVKRLPNNTDLPLPSYQSNGSSGLDLHAAVTRDLTLQPGDIELIPTGLAVSLPQGYEAQIRARSGLALQYGLGFVNAPGTIDADYRGEIGLIAINWGKRPLTIRRGERVAQMVIHSVTKVVVEEVDELDSTQRGEGGFGHSGC